MPPSHVAIIVKVAAYRRCTNTLRVFLVDILAVKQIYMLLKGMDVVPLPLTVARSLHWRENLQLHDFGFMD